VTGIAALWPGTLIPPVTAQEQKTSFMRASVGSRSGAGTR
jgi:hypothetical protein